MPNYCKNVFGSSTNLQDFLNLVKQDETINLEMTLTDGTFYNDNPISKTDFLALDTNSDGVVNSSDTGFGSLKIWQDMNEDRVLDYGKMSINADLFTQGSCVIWFMNKFKIAA